MTVRVAKSGSTPLPFMLREKILREIVSNPGIKQKCLSGGMSVNQSTISHHVRGLEKERMISRRKIGRAVYCFPYFEGDIPSGVLVKVVLKEHAKRSIIELVAYEPLIYISEVARRLERKPSTIKWHVERLVTLGILVTDCSQGYVKMEIHPEIQDVLIDSLQFGAMESVVALTT